MVTSVITDLESVAPIDQSRTLLESGFVSKSSQIFGNDVQKLLETFLNNLKMCGPRFTYFVTRVMSCHDGSGEPSWGLWGFIVNLTMECGLTVQSASSNAPDIDTKHSQGIE
jgi:hypothetical protein